VEGKPIDEARIYLAFHKLLKELLRYRKSLYILYRVTLNDRRRLKQLEKKVSSFVEPS